MNKYECCFQANCEKFKAAEEHALRVNNSALDAAFDVQEFVDNCCKHCELFRKAVEEGKVKDE